MSSLTQEIERLEAQIAYQSQRIGDLEAAIIQQIAHHRQAEKRGGWAHRIYHLGQAEKLEQVLEDD